MKANKKKYGVRFHNMYIALIIVIGILTLIYIFQFRRQKVTFKQISIVSRKKIEELKSLNEKYKNMILNNISSESSLLDPDLLLTDVISKSEIKIHDIAQNSPVLVLRFTEYSCHACVEQSLLKIKNLSQPFKPEKFIILTSYMNLRDLVLFRSDNDIIYSVYVINNDSLTVPLESLNFPYFFILNKEHET